MFTFDKDTHRYGSGCVKWDEDGADVIPLWVADMDFEAAPAIQEALYKRVSHGVFGYTHVSQSYYDSIIRWYERRHNILLDKEWIIYTTGVVPAVSACIKALTLPSEQVIIMTPAYNCFFSCIRNNGCETVTSLLLYNPDAAGQGGEMWTIDYADLEVKCSEARARVLLLCNPHNPVGRVWTKDELLRVYDICRRHGVTVIADEIHNEITMPGYDYVPFARISDGALRDSVTCFSPTKGFNIAGLQIANIFCADADRRYRIDRAINLNECCDVNPFGVIALQAAYNDSEEWLDAMCEYVWNNYLLLKERLHEINPSFVVSPLQGTYLAWVDIRSTGLSSDQLMQLWLERAHVRVASGSVYGIKDGEGFVRINLACPRSLLDKALNNIRRITNY